VKARKRNSRDVTCGKLTRRVRFRWSCRANHFYDSRHPVPEEGALAIVTNAGTGCGGRGGFVRAMGRQGGINSVSGPRMRKTSGAEAYGEVVWA